MPYTPSRDARTHTASQPAIPPVSLTAPLSSSSAASSASSGATHSAILPAPAAPPVHRWLRFADSWDERAVHRAFDLIGVRRREVIYDPFVGCGTTPVAAAARGHRTVSMDRSALAVLGTVVKLYPPDPAMLDEVAEKLRSCPCNILIRKLQVRRLRRGAASPTQRTLVFALVAGWFRARDVQPWQNVPCASTDVPPDVRWLEESLRIIEEMRADQPPPGTRPIQHVVRCREFSNDVSRLPGLTGHNSIVMITSPPLPTRHIDLDRQRLDRMIHTTVPRLRIFDRHDHHTESLAAVEMRRVATYEKFIDSLLAHAQRLQCTAVAIEMSNRPAPQGMPCDELLVERLPAFGFKLLDVDRSIREASGVPGSGNACPREWLSTVCAVAIDSPSSTLPSENHSSEPPTT
jgi:hypothetical protein